VLLKTVYPRLRDFCRSLSLGFDVVLMRWGVLARSGDEHLTSELCMSQLEMCKRESFGLSLLTPQGYRYGSYVKRRKRNPAWCRVPRGTNIERVRRICGDGWKWPKRGAKHTKQAQGKAGSEAGALFKTLKSSTIGLLLVAARFQRGLPRERKEKQGCGDGSPH